MPEWSGFHFFRRSRRHWYALDREFCACADARILRQRCESLIDAAERHGAARKPLLKRTLPRVVRSLPPAAVVAVLDLVLSLLSRDVDLPPAPRAGKSAGGLAMLDILVPALSRARLSEEELLARLGILSCCLAGVRGRKNDTSVWQALADVAALPGDVLGPTAEAVVDLWRSGFDPQPLARWTSTSSGLLGGHAFRRLLEHAVQLAKMRLDPQQLLNPFLQQAQPPLSAPDFQALMETLEQIAGARQQREAASVIPALGRAVSALPADRLRLVLDLTQRMLSSGNNPAPVLEALPALAGLEEPRLTAAVDLASRMAAAGVGSVQELRHGVPAAAEAVGWLEYLESIDTAIRLVERKIDPLPLLRYGVPLASRIAEYGAALRVVEQHLLRTAAWSSTWSSWRSQGLKAVYEPRTAIELEETLRWFEVLVDRIQRSGGGPNTSPGLAELCRQAFGLAREYRDFAVTFHPAVTHEEESYDSYYGTTSSTIEDEPSRLELKPAGDRHSTLSLALRSSAETETSLTERSWLWRSLGEPAKRERALERGAAVRGRLGLIVDRLMRSGILKPHQEIAALYLIGSYLWRERPEDIDLFFLVEGCSNIARFTGAALVSTGFEIPDADAPLDIEIVGWETILDAVRGGSVRHARALAQRYTLLYGSALLAGRDLHEGLEAPLADLKSLRLEILANSRRAEWPELAGDAAKIQAKREWRRHEAEALRRFLEDRGEPRAFGL